MLGQNSLYVYIVHSLLVFSVSLVWPKSTGLIGNILIDVAVISTIVFLVRKRVFFDQVGIKPGFALPSSVVNLVRETLTFKYVYGWADFLQYYAAFLFVSPLAIWLLRKKYWWLVRALSLAVWLKSGQNFYLSWQLLFFSGAVFGYYVEDIHTWYKSLRSGVQRRLRYLAVAIAGITVLS